MDGLSLQIQGESSYKLKFEMKQMRLKYRQEDNQRDSHMDLSINRLIVSNDCSDHSDRKIKSLYRIMSSQVDVAIEDENTT